MRQKNENNLSGSSIISILILLCVLAGLAPSARAGNTPRATLTQPPSPSNSVALFTPPPPENEEPRSIAADPLVLTQSAQTDADEPGVVYNGGTVTYTLSLHNQGATTIANILVKDFLPREGERVYYVQDITCITDDPACSFIDNTYSIPLPSGNTVAVTATREISWAIASLAPDGIVELQFSGTVLGQPDGTTFTNNAEATYEGRVVRSPSLTLMVEVLLEVSGEATVSSVPTWFSQDIGGTISQDWGDFNRDGLLDLALGSSVGVSVYGNEEGALNEVSFDINAGEEYRPAYGVRWADVISDADGCLELIVVGDSVGDTSTGPGINYIYHYNGDSFVELGQFDSDYQLVRIEPGDYDQDGDIDLIGSTNSINADCNVSLYFNDGQGNFDTVAAACLSWNATAALAAADYDYDGDLDLAIGAFPGTMQLLQNDLTVPMTDTNTFDTGTPVLLESFLEYIPYDLAWGDYDQDTDLDLAAAYPIQREVHVYENQDGAELVPFQSLTTGPFMTPLALDWADFNGDGRVELAVTDSPPIFYYYDVTDEVFQEWTLDLPTNSGQIWSVRGIDLQNQSNLDLIMTNRDGPSQIFPAFSPNLESDLTAVTPSSWSAGSVAWGDTDGDGALDLLFGSATAPNSSSFLYINQDGTFPSGQGLADSFGPQTVTFGNIGVDDRLDTAIGMPAALQVYLDGSISSPIDIPSEEGILSLAWADPDDDSQSELLVGYAADDDGLGQIELLQFDGVTVTPSFTATVDGDVRSLAWADVDGDYYLDFAVGIDGGSVQVYRNTGGCDFSLDWQSPDPSTTRAVAWADVDADGDPDLAAGYYGAQDVVWQNDGGTFTALPFGPPDSRTTSLAWGDWNNDGYPDLAVGIDDGQDVVYANLGSEPGTLRLSPLWNSAETAVTTGVAWGDADGDGDLDLAVSRMGGVESGFHENTMWPAAHLTGDNTLNDPTLPNTPVYVSVDRPSTSPAAYFYSAPELVTGPNHPTVTVTYRLFDPEAVPVAETFFEYSLDGGGVWLQATPDISSTLPTNETSRSGIHHAFVWDARADVAISDNALFRVRVTHQDTLGNSQRATSIGVSPPFRVRSLDCYWPVGAAITASNEHPEPGEEIILTATLAYGSGQLQASWDLDDGTSDTGWVITHTFQSHDVFNVTLRVDGPACPIARPAFVHKEIVVGLGGLPPAAFLPFVANNHSATARSPSSPSATSEPVPAPPNRSAPRQSVPIPTAFISTSPAEDELPQTRGVSEGRAAPLSDGFIQVNRNQIGFQSQPAINGDGRIVAFWSTGDFDTSGSNTNPDGNIEIFLAEIQSAQDIAYTQITSSTGSILGGFNLYPDIDYAGDTVVFFSDGDLIEGQNSDLNFEIFLAQISPTGSLSLTQVTRTSQGVNILPSISGNGRRIAFVSDQDLDGINPDGNQEIFVAEIDSSGRVSDTIQITGSDGCFNDRPSLSSDGKFVAFVSDCDGNREIYLTELGTNGGPVSTVQVTTSADGYNETPSIDGDGSRIAFLSTMDDPTGPAQIYLAEIDTATPAASSVERLTHDNTRKVQPSISADGLRMAFITVESPTVRRLSLYDIANNYPVRLETGDDNLYPALTSDGRGVAYVSNWDILLTNPPDNDLAIEKTALPALVAVGDSLDYDLVVKNQGLRSAADAVVSDTLPIGVIAQLPAQPGDYVDDDGTPTGFGGGDEYGAYWDPDIEALTMSASSNSEVNFISRIMESSNGAHGWNSIGLRPTRPLAMPLPDYNAVESGYSDGNVDMADNVLLLHTDDLPGSQIFRDTSGRGHHFVCSDPANPDTCPGAGVDGIVYDAIDLDPLYNQSLIHDDTGPDTESDLVLANDFTLALWVNPADTNGHYVFISKHIDNAEGSWDTVHFGMWYGEYLFKLRDVLRNQETVTTGWQHLALVGRAIDTDQTEVTLYRNGEVLWTLTYNTVANDLADGMWAIGNDFDGAYGANDFHNGEIDEVAIFNRALSEEEVQDIYLRGALQARLQVRACNDSDCSGESFAGPDGTDATYYPMLPNYAEGFEYDDGGYPHQGTYDEWEWGTPTNWPYGCASGTSCWGTDLDGNYNNYASQVLYSPLIDLSDIRAGSQVTLEWWQASYIERHYYDQAYAQISYNGGPWLTMWQNPDSSTAIPWTQEIRDVSAGIGGFIQLRWQLITDYSVTYSGYHIDNVRIRVEPYPPAFEEDTFGRYPPAFLLNLPTDQPYFQYQVYLDTYDNSDVPEVTSIAVNPRVNCGGTEGVTCYLDGDLPLAAGRSVTWTIPTLVTADAHEGATPRGSNLVFTNTATVRGAGFELAPGDNTATAETYLQTTTVGDFVWEDTNGDGIQNDGNGMGNVTVRLHSSKDDSVVQTTTTNVSGTYTFINPPPGDYYIVFEAPADYFFTQIDAGNDDTIDSDAAPDGRTTDLSLSSGDHVTIWDAGLYRLVTLGGYVWEDIDGDGLQEAGEPSMQNVQVQLRNNQGVVNMTTTAADGTYDFQNIPPGRYAICFVAPVGHAFTLQDVGADDTIDSDVSSSTGCTAFFNMNSGSPPEEWDAGLYQPISLGDLVWEDMDADGIQNDGATGISQVVIRLYDPGADGVIGGGDDQIVATTQSNSVGSYSFTGLAPGSYYLEFVAPAGYAFTAQNAGADDTVDSDADASGLTSVLTFASGDVDNDQDAGLYQAATVGNFVWEDSNGNGIQNVREPGIQNVLVELRDDQGSVITTTTTASDGTYQFSGLAPGSYSLCFTAPAAYAFTLQDAGTDDTADSDADPATGCTTTFDLASGATRNRWDAGLYQPSSVGDFVWEDANGDGTQNPGEPGIQGVTVDLHDDQGTVIDTTTTASDGTYQFSGLAPGVYSTCFTAPAAYTFTLQDAGSDNTIDSDADPASGCTTSFSLTSGDTPTHWDAGLYRPTSVGDFVWEDMNADGIQGINAPGLGNVTVRLYESGGTFLDSTTSAADGSYSFTDLGPGTYYLEFVAPAGYTFTQQDAGTNDAYDSDANPANGQTALITLLSGETDMTWDAGLYQPATLGGQAWEDTDNNDVRDDIDPGIGSVTVRLYDSGGTLLDSTTTAADGSYSFTGLIPGSYYLEFVAPSGYVFVQQDVGGDDTLDSDAHPVTGRTDPTTLRSGESDTTWDAGLRATP